MISPTLKQRYGNDLKWLDRFKPRLRLPDNKGYLFAKRLFDALFVILSSPVWIPLIIIISILIKLESPRDPIFFLQERTGKNGYRFCIYKFRTMVPNAEALKYELMHLNELQWPDFKIKDDPRITRVGKILRKTSLDELPQIFNLLLGQMTLVGPRPTSFRPETYTLWQTERLDVIPGITGLWQILGRNKTEFDERSQLDIAYIERACLRLDIEILLRTFQVLFTRRAIGC
ncbi:undecaprenyl-phosphate galactose phosphotransferase [Methylocaldum marinum]|uniref:Undecaprenyl-phosphate galactose phosphotransferase n=1 Tax=Methylocaldum marinum TaxID=1432792 RepID=A0A286P3L7_9GAMM|nr:sugar transferase [Methylocaldum marinum]BBA32239.1 undecaprenyl-phosphate galactose phosphotransferase [Methylocaldum marinum]